jgi:hypothetical protein
MFTFVSPNSINSNWIYFEAGFAYSKGINVVPTSINGQLLENVKPPLSLLQGFNIKNHAGLNNIIALINSECEFSHPESFTKSEFESLFKESASEMQSEFESYVDSIKVEINHFENWATFVESGFKDNLAGFQTVEANKEYNGYGMRIRETSNNGVKSIEFECDPIMWFQNQSVIDDIISHSTAKDKGFEIFLSLNPQVEEITSFSKITSRIFNSDITLSKKEGLVYKGCELRVSHYMSFGVIHGGSNRRGASFIAISGMGKKLSELELYRLVDLLISREVIFREY